MPQGEGDDFEKSTMQDGSRILHRDKRVSRGLSAILCLAALMPWAIAILIAFTNDTSSKPLSPGAVPIVVGLLGVMGVMFVVMGIMFGVVRTIVTEHAVNVKFGMWGPEIPLASIVSAKAVDYDFMKFGGWGIRRSLDGTWAYVPGGDRVLELVYTDGKKERKVLVGCENPEETARQIERARNPVRIDVPAEAAREEEDEEIADKKLSKQ